MEFNESGVVNIFVGEEILVHMYWVLCLEMKTIKGLPISII